MNIEKEIEDIKHRLLALEVRMPRKVFTKPSKEEVELYGKEIGFKIDGQQFVDFYESKGWKVGQTPMKDWRAAVRTWHKKYKETHPEAKPIKERKYYQPEPVTDIETKNIKEIIEEKVQSGIMLNKFEKIMYQRMTCEKGQEKQQ